jgi:excisionase family DNA binding protein
MTAHPHVTRYVFAHYASYHDAAALLAVSVDTIGRMVADKQLPAVVVRGQKRIPLDALRKLLLYDPEDE